MKSTLQEPIYINPDIYQGETGTSAIANVPMNTPIIYGENPYLSTNESGQIVVNQPTPISTSNTSVGGVKNNLLDFEIEPITPTPSTSTTTSTTSSSSSTTTTPTATSTTSTTSTSTPSNIGTNEPSMKKNKNMKYLLYGGGTLVVAYIVYKLVKK